MGKIQIEKLNPHPKNTYYFTDIDGEKYEEIKRSIHTYGIRDPIKVTTAYTIISGHQRHRIAKDLDLLEVPVEIVDVNEWDAEYMLIAENVERRGEAESDPIKKGRIAAFLKEYWGIKKGGDMKAKGENPLPTSIKEIGIMLGESLDKTKTLIKLNDLIPQFQALVSLGKLGTTAAEQLAFLTVEEQTELFEKMGEAITSMTVDEVKRLRKDIEDLREENKNLKVENKDLKEEVEILKNKKVEPDKTEIKKLEDQLELEKKEKVKYKEHVVKLQNKVDEYKLLNTEDSLSPEAILYVNRHLEIAEDCHKLIEKITVMTIITPTDLPYHISENYKKLFYETGTLLMESYDKLINQIQYIEVEKGEE